MPPKLFTHIDLIMLIQQSKNSFIRTTKRYGYIINQLTRQDRSYNESGADWLREISREPRDIETIITKLTMLYEDVDVNILRKDFMEFAESLADNGFVVIGNTPEELAMKDASFTYNVALPKTLKEDFYQDTKEIVHENTRDFFS